MCIRDRPCTVRARARARGHALHTAPTGGAWLSCPCQHLCGAPCQHPAPRSASPIPDLQAWPTQQRLLRLLRAQGAPTAAVGHALRGQLVALLARHGLLGAPTQFLHGAPAEKKEAAARGTSAAPARLPLWCGQTLPCAQQFGRFQRRVSRAAVGHARAKLISDGRAVSPSAAPQSVLSHGPRQLRPGLMAVPTLTAGAVGVIEKPTRD